MGRHSLARNGPCLAHRRLLLRPAPRHPRLPPLLSLPHPSPRPRPHPPPQCLLRLLPPPLLSFRDLRSATASFDPSCSLGCGASAIVFRGVLPDGKSVAVKRLDHPSSSSPSPSSSPPQTFSDREFHNEVHVLAALSPSPFVVSLLGYCLDSPHCRLLVYEYMPNGTCPTAASKTPSSPPPIIISSSAGIAGSALSSTSPSPRLPQLGSPIRKWIGRHIGPSSNTGTMRGRTRRRTASIPRNSSQVERLDGGEDALFGESGLDASVGKPKKK